MAARPGNNFRAAAKGKTPLQRFAEKCEFDATTGCVIWKGGTSAGRGNTTRYGVFWAEGRRVFAHRWAAVHIHGIDLGSDDAGHCCPGRPNSLCVQHLSGQTKADNIAERNTRVAKATQLADVRQHFLFVQYGFRTDDLDDGMSAALEKLNDVPFHTPPEWLRPFMTKAGDNDDCPF